MVDLHFGPDLRPILFRPDSCDTDKNMLLAYQLYYFRRDFRSAAGIYRGLLAEHPEKSEVRHLLGLAYFDMGMPVQAIAEMKAALADKEHAPAIFFANYGLVLASQQQWSPAIEALREACRREPEQQDFNTKLAAVLLKAGRLDEATEVVDRSLVAQPPDIQALETRGVIKLMQLPPERRDAPTPQNFVHTVGEYSVTISARSKSGPVAEMLKQCFPTVPLKCIDSIFGFSEPCRLYGGRGFRAPELDASDLKWMYANGIGYRIPLTNLLSTEEDYKGARSFLEKHHRAGNSVIVVKDEIAQWIRRDFPLYKIEASVIRGTDTAEKLLKALEIFDTIVPLPSAFNTDYELLKGFPQETKDRIRLFLNSGCAYHCPRRICYLSFSRMNRQEKNARFECSQRRLSYHFTQGMSDFPMQRFIDLGYHKFKVLRVVKATGGTAY